MKSINLEPDNPRDTCLANKVRPPDFSQENHEIEKQKLDRANRRQNHQWKSNLTTPKIPTLQTSMRARRVKITSSKELEKDHEKPPKFKARPLNKKILDSKGDLGLFCIKKRQVTIPQEFHFAIDERIPPSRTANTNAKFYEKIRLCLESHNKKPIPRNTIPRPFHLQTQERGARIRKSYPNPCISDN